PFGNLFEPADKKQKIFSRKSGPGSFYHPAVSQDLPAERKEVAGARRGGSIEAFRAEPNALREADRVMVNQYAPPSVLINADLEVLQFRGSTSAFLEPPAGKASFNVLKMAREGL